MNVKDRYPSLVATTLLLVPPGITILVGVSLGVTLVGSHVPDTVAVNVPVVAGNSISGSCAIISPAKVALSSIILPGVPDIPCFLYLNVSKSRFTASKAFGTSNPCVATSHLVPVYGISP